MLTRKELVEKIESLETRIDSLESSATQVRTDIDAVTAVVSEAE